MTDNFAAAIQQLTAEGPFAITTTEVRGIPLRAYAAAPPNMRFVWEMSAAHGDAEYIVYNDERYSYADTHARVRSLAHALADTYGIKRGDRVAVSMRNYPEWIMSYWAITSLGAAIVGMNAWWTGPEMEYGLRDASPKVLICDRERLHNVEPHLSTLRSEHQLDLIVVRVDQAAELPDGAAHWNDIVDPSTAPAALPEAHIDPDDDACIFYTSGTTGFPKGAQLTHRGTVANLMNMAVMPTAAALAKQMSGMEVPDPASAPTPSVLLPVPLFHVTGCNCVLHPITLAGGKLVSMYKWDPDEAIDIIEREKITVFTGVPTMSRELLLSPKWADADTSSLGAMGGGGAALQPDLVDKIDKGLSKSGGSPQTGYGLTETCGIVTSLSDVFFINKPDSAGPIVPSMEARIVDDNGNDMPQGELGELIVRGSNVIKGYLNQPEATADAIRDGWFHTGDIAFIDEDGYVHIRDRKKDIVIRGGENIHCGEVEAAIYEHPAVAEAAVFGVPDDRLGEEVGVAIVLAPGAHLDEAELRAHLDDRLARFKIPAYVWFRDEPLPRNANGKFVKRDLKAQLLRD